MESGEPLSGTPAICIVAYQHRAGEALKQLAISIERAPYKIRVDDDQACELPDYLSESQLQKYVVSCFEAESKPIVILDYALFSQAELN